MARRIQRAAELRTRHRAKKVAFLFLLLASWKLGLGILEARLDVLEARLGVLEADRASWMLD